MWLVLWQLPKTVAEKGVESVKIKVSRDPEAGFMLIGVITASGQRLPLFLVAKGLISKCHMQFGKNFNGLADHSKSGWVNQDVFLRFLLFLRQNRGTGPVALVLDEYPGYVRYISQSLIIQTRNETFGRFPDAIRIDSRFNQSRSWLLQCDT
jgi:hypothetical protein